MVLTSIHAIDLPTPAANGQKVNAVLKFQTLRKVRWTCPSLSPTGELNNLSFPGLFFGCHYRNPCPASFPLEGSLKGKAETLQPLQIRKDKLQGSHPVSTKSGRNSRREQKKCQVTELSALAPVLLDSHPKDRHTHTHTHTHTEL